MAKNNVSLAVVYEGERTRLNENLEKAIQEELRRVTGLNHEGVTLSPKRRVKVTLLAQVGKKQGESYTGVSNESLDEAIKDASKDGQVQFDPSKPGPIRPFKSESRIRSNSTGTLFYRTSY